MLLDLEGGVQHGVNRIFAPWARSLSRAEGPSAPIGEMLERLHAVMTESGYRGHLEGQTNRRPKGVLVVGGPSHGRGGKQDEAGKGGE